RARTAFTWASISRSPRITPRSTSRSAAPGPDRDRRQPLTASLSPQETQRERFGLGTFALVLAGVAAAAPLLLGPGALRLVGTLLMIAGLLEVLHAFRRVREDIQRSAYSSAGLTFLMGLLVVSAPALAETALTWLLAASFVVDAVQRAVELRRGRDRRTTTMIFLAIAGDVAMAIFFLLLWRKS